MARNAGWWAGVIVSSVAACGDNWAAPELREGPVCPPIVMREVNDRWIDLHPEPGDAAWERATYFIGDMAAAVALAEPRYLEYAIGWAELHHYKLNDGTDTRNADNHAAGQVYLQLYDLEPDPAKIADISASLDNVIRSGERADWSWIDAQFMASPAFAHMGALSSVPRYHETMIAMFRDARDRRRLYDADEGLWYRDENYLFPDETTPSGRKNFWSRGNGWVIGGVVRTLAHLAPGSPYRGEYEDMLRAMAAGLAAVQRDDGLWNVSLADPEHYPGPESSGTAFFIYGIAWGINAGVLDRDTYVPVVERAWRGLVARAVRADGELGYVQGVGEEPGSSQPVKLRSTHDYGVGAFLLAGSELVSLALPFDCVQ